MYINKKCVDDDNGDYRQIIYCELTLVNDFLCVHACVQHAHACTCEGTHQD